MRCTTLFVCFSLYLFLTFNSVGIRYVYLTLSPVPPSSRVSYSLHETKHVPTIKRTVLLDRILFFLIISILWLVFLQYQLWLYMCSKTHYIHFDTNLNLFKKNKNYSILPLKCSYLWYPLASILALVFLCEHESDFIHFLLEMSPNLEFLFCSKPIFYILSKFKKTISMTLFVTSVILIFSNATTPGAQYVSICVFQIFCFSFAKKYLHGCRPYYY